MASGRVTNLVYGGRGNDTLTGDDQDNTFVFVKGDGQDRLTVHGRFSISAPTTSRSTATLGETVLSRAGSGGVDPGITFTAVPTGST